MRIGIDLGGSKTEAVLLDEADSVLERMREPTPWDAGYEGVLDLLAGFVARLDEAARRRASPAGQPPTVGMGIPGCLDRASGRVKNANSVGLIGRPLQADLEARLGPRVRLANDANCFAVAEALAGAARGHAVVFGVILGTGVGGGLVLDGEAREGLHGIAGEWGHSPIEDRDPEGPPAPACYCGQHGCVETRLSGPAFERDYERLSGSACAAPEILRRLAAGDADAAHALDRYLGFFGEGLARIIHLLDPDAIVLGGGMSKTPQLYERGRDAIERVLFDARLKTPLLRHQLGDSAGVFGAAWLWGGRTVVRPEDPS